MAKKTIRVHTPFNFQFEDGASQRFEAGEHTVDDKVADHWFVTAHSDITGKAKASADTKDFQAQIDSLNAQLAEKDKAYGELQQSVADKDQAIAELTAQLEALKAPVTEPEPETEDDGKKQKSADGK